MTTQNGHNEEKVDRMEMIRSNARKAMLLGFGLAGMAQDRFMDAQENILYFFDDLVDRGEDVEKESRERADEIVERLRSRAKRTQEKVETGLDEQVDDLVDRLNIPTVEDLDKLTKKVNSLNRKVDALKKEAQKKEAIAVVVEKEAA
jgi:poly(hydroxyalkanoate) granule-associated protein